jgi:hypothetical protein
LGRLVVKRSQAAFVGDHPEVDVAGAQAAGMLASWRRDPKCLGAIEADAVIEELADLPALLGLPGFLLIGCDVLSNFRSGSISMRLKPIGLHPTKPLDCRASRGLQVMCAGDVPVGGLD